MLLKFNCQCAPTLFKKYLKNLVRNLWSHLMGATGGLVTRHKINKLSLT